MNESDSGVPEAVLVDERSKRKTTEFCVDAHDGHRCMLVKGHSGMHEAVGKVGAMRWLSDVAT